jgi:hypothetical protein
MSTWEQELGELKVRVERLETTMRRLADTTQPATSPASDQLTDSEQLLTWLKAEGVVREPTVEEHRLAAAWDALSEEEKQTHLRCMRSLTFDPPLSQILTDNRR